MSDTTNPPGSAPREVYDGWAYWRIRLTESTSFWRRRSGWRYVAERRFTGWRQEFSSRWFADRVACERAAHRFLDGKAQLRGDLLGGR